jgi:hypothetical protein
MTTKEKAQELVDKFLQFTPVEFEYEYAKQCALIAVDEAMYSLSVIPYGMEYLSKIDYWEEVKQEINNL